MNMQATKVFGSGIAGSGEFPIEPAVTVPAGSQIQFVRQDVFVIATDDQVGVYKLDGDTFRRIGTVDL